MVVPRARASILASERAPVPYIQAIRAMALKMRLARIVEWNVQERPTGTTRTIGNRGRSHGSSRLFKDLRPGGQALGQNYSEQLKGGPSGCFFSGSSRITSTGMETAADTCSSVRPIMRREPSLRCFWPSTSQSACTSRV